MILFAVLVNMKEGPVGPEELCITGSHGQEMGQQR